MGEGRVGVIMVKNFKGFRFDPPHPAPLPPGEREFLDENRVVPCKVGFNAGWHWDNKGAS